MKNVDKPMMTTGQMRLMLAKAAEDVLSGALDLEKAKEVGKLAKAITESLYSETKIAMFKHEIGESLPKMGDLPIGGSDAS